MDSSGLFNSAVRIKEEPYDDSFVENDSEITDETADFKNIHLSRFRGENSVRVLQKCNDNLKRELDEVNIELECVDQKPNVNLLLIKKNDDYCQGNLQNMKFSEYQEAQKSIKVETTGEVKSEFLGDVATTLNLDSGLVEKNSEKRLTNAVNNQRKSKTKTDVGRSKFDHNCDMCNKRYAHKQNLKVHIDTVHKNIKYACDLCGKTFSQKCYLKIHIDSIHNGVKHPCDICGKSFSQRSNLKIHIDSIHNGVTHICNVCGKTLSNKCNLQKHISSVHNGVTHSCDICPKTFTRKDNLLSHMNSVHSGITHACDLCEKKYKHQSVLNKHFKTSHNVIYKCETCRKTFGHRRNLKAHIDMAHRSRTMTQ